MAKTPLVFLLHIRDAIELIRSYINDSAFEQFQSDNKTRDAVVRELEVIGEATINLTDEFKVGYPEIPWREIADFRNVLAHEYWQIDYEIVWKAATLEIDELSKAISPIIKNLQSKT